MGWGCIFGATHLLLEGNVGEGMVVEAVAFGGEQIYKCADSAVIWQPLLQLGGILEQLSGMQRGKEKTGQASNGQACVCGLKLRVITSGRPRLPSQSHVGAIPLIHWCQETQ